VLQEAFYRDVMCELKRLERAFANAPLGGGNEAANAVWCRPFAACSEPSNIGRLQRSTPREIKRLQRLQSMKQHWRWLI
jgi:hypothetical protein